MLKLITNKNIELMELKNGAVISIPNGTELEILNNKDNRILEFKYKGYSFKELITNSFHGLELIETEEPTRAELIQLKGNLNQILDTNILNIEAIQKAEELEQLNIDNKIKLNSNLIEIFELLTLIKSDVEMTIKRAIKEAIKQKKEAFEKFIERQNYFTDNDRLENVDAIFYDKGIYLKFTGTRNNLNVFINNDFKVIRKPVKALELKRIFVNNLNIEIN